MKHGEGLSKAAWQRLATPGWCECPGRFCLTCSRQGGTSTQRASLPFRDRVAGVLSVSCPAFPERGSQASLPGGMTWAGSPLCWAVLPVGSAPCGLRSLQGLQSLPNAPSLLFTHTVRHKHKGNASVCVHPRTRIQQEQILCGSR